MIRLSGWTAPACPSLARRCDPGLPIERDTSFIFRQLSRITGYIDPLDALVFHTPLEGETENGHQGNLAEIGVCYGRSYFLLRKLAQPRKTVLAIDHFDIGSNRAGPSSQTAEFV